MIRNNIFRLRIVWVDCMALRVAVARLKVKTKLTELRHQEIERNQTQATKHRRCCGTVGGTDSVM